MPNSAPWDRSADTQTQSAGDAPNMAILPGHFASPHKMPVHFDIVYAADDHGNGWVVMRVETVHGSHVTFLAPDLAEAIARDLADVAPRARLAVFDE